MSIKGSLVGHVFDADNPETLPSFVLRMTPDARRAWAQEQTERYRVVATCAICGRELIEGEQVPHRMTHASPKAASAAMTVYQRGPAVAREALELLHEILGG